MDGEAVTTARTTTSSGRPHRLQLKAAPPHTPYRNNPQRVHFFKSRAKTCVGSSEKWEAGIKLWRRWLRTEKKKTTTPQLLHSSHLSGLSPLLHERGIRHNRASRWIQRNAEPWEQGHWGGRKQGRRPALDGHLSLGVCGRDAGFSFERHLKSPNTSTRVLPSLPYVHFTDERVAIPDSDQRRAMFAAQFGGSPASAAGTKNQDLTHGSIAPEGKKP
jgi:hypothetical protein